MIKRSFTDSELETIKKYLLGGAAVGGSAALVTSMVNYLNKIKRQNSETTDDDDDTLYVYKKKASLTNGLAISGSVISALASYLALKKVYQKFRENEAQKELDEAQHVFIDESGYKEASAGRKGIGFWGGVAGLPVALPILLALAGGVTVNSILKSKFPEKTEKIKAPRRIEVIDPSELEGVDKEASYDVDTDAQEFLCRMTLLSPVENSQLQGLQKTAALGGHEAFKHTAMQLGIVPALETVKGASAHAVDPVNEHLALCWMNKCAYLRPSVGLIAAGEFAESFPHACRQAANLDPETQDSLLKIASLFGQAFRSERTEELGLFDGEDTEFSKQAADDSEEDVLSRVLTKLNEKEQSGGSSDGTLLGAEPVTAGDENESSEMSGELAGTSAEDSNSRPTEQQKRQFIGTSKSLRRYSGEGPTDIIDKLLSPGK